MCCCVLALWLGLCVARREGVIRGFCSPFQRQGSCLPSAVPQGHQGGLAQPEGLGGRAEPCGAAGQLALVSVPAAGVLPQVPPATLGTAPVSAAGLAPRGGGRAAWGGRLCPSLPAACSEPFSSQMLYMK